MKRIKEWVVVIAVAAALLLVARVPLPKKPVTEPPISGSPIQTPVPKMK